MGAATDIQTEVENWLKTALTKDGIEELSSIKIVGGSSKGDGYLGDIIFVNATGKKNGTKIEYNLALKCGKRSEALRATAPVRIVYENEVYVYTEVFPKFRQFQLEKLKENIFDSVAKCYGTIMTDDVEILVLENLKSLGYYLYDKSKPLTRKHVEVVLKEYGKWHATSAALADQQPDRFGKITDGLKDVWGKFLEDPDFMKIFITSIDFCVKQLEGVMSENAKKKLIKLRDQVPDVLNYITNGSKGFKVLLHGDCWNNNFMHKNDSQGEPSKVIMLDWQASRMDNPIYDISYFLYTVCLEEELKDIKGVLKIYYSSFSNHLRQLGSDPEKLYTFDQLWNDWKRLGKFGVIMASMLMKICHTDSTETVDISEAAERGEKFGEAFNHGDVSYKEDFVKRITYIFNQAIVHDVV